MCLVNLVDYELAEKIYNKTASVKKFANDIKKEVKEIESKSKLTPDTLTEQGAFMKWLENNGIKEEYITEYKKRKQETKINNSMDFVEELLEGIPDIVEIYGETGSNKSSLVIELAKNKARRGLKVLYIDTERNLTKSQIEEMKKLGVVYEYLPEFKQLVSFIDSLNKKYDFLILDSVGLPALGEFARSNMKGKGSILLNVQAILYSLKIYTARHGCYAVVINQPSSEMNKVEYVQYMSKFRKEFKLVKTNPFGDKGSFYVKEILRSIVVSRGNGKTVCEVFAWRSRRYAFGTPVLQIVREGNKLDVKKII